MARTKKDKADKIDEPKKKSGGAIGKYSPDFPQLVEMYAREGLIDSDIAKKLGISNDTFYEYKKRHPEFAEALKKGKAPVDFEVENALLKRALGYEYEEVTEESGTNEKGTWTKKTVAKKFIAPDVTAQIFWLKNRRPDRWNMSEASKTATASIEIDLHHTYHNGQSHSVLAQKEENE